MRSGPLQSGAVDAEQGARLPARRQQDRCQVRDQQDHRSLVGTMLRRCSRRKQARWQAAQPPSGSQGKLEIAAHPLPAPG